MTEITKVSKNLGTLTMKEIDVQTAKDMIIKNHYSKKWNSSFGKINIGVFKDERLLGIAVFGNLMNPKSFKNISDYGEGSVIELNRLWIDDELGHNAETILISSSFKIIKADYPVIRFVQSFADGRLGCGTIYKASNFKYFGYEETLFFEDKETGEVLHKVPLENTKRPLGMLGKNARYLSGKLKPFKVKTYKYIFPLYKKDVIKLKEHPYPEYDKGTIESDYEHPDSLIVRLMIMYNEIGMDNLKRWCYQILKERGNSKDDIIELMEKQKQNKSIIWYKTEYLQNNREKLIETIEGALK